VRYARFWWFRFPIHFRARWARWGAGCSVLVVQISYSHSSPLGSVGRGIRGISGPSIHIRARWAQRGAGCSVLVVQISYSHSSPLGSAGRGMLGLGGSDFLFTFEPAGLGGVRVARYRWFKFPIHIRARWARRGTGCSVAMVQISDSNSRPLGAAGRRMLCGDGSDFLCTFEPVGLSGTRDARFRWFRFSIQIRARWARRGAGCSVSRGCSRCLFKPRFSTFGCYVVERLFG
jgi:hypothetical protein